MRFECFCGSSFGWGGCESKYVFNTIKNHLKKHWKVEQKTLKQLKKWNKENKQC